MREVLRDSMIQDCGYIYDAAVYSGACRTKRSPYIQAV